MQGIKEIRISKEDNLMFKLRSTCSDVTNLAGTLECNLMAIFQMITDIWEEFGNDIPERLNNRLYVIHKLADDCFIQVRSLMKHTKSS